MSRIENRAQQGAQRASVYQRGQRVRTALFVVALLGYVVVPLLWHGAIALGWIHPMLSDGFQRATAVASAVLLITILFLLPELLIKRLARERGHLAQLSQQTCDDEECKNYSARPSVP